jgi:hypothetical protein
MMISIFSVVANIKLSARYREETLLVRWDWDMIRIAAIKTADSSFVRAE